MSIDPQNRREFLKLTSGGVSALALSSLLNQSHAAGGGPAPKLHHAPKAKSVILLYMSGGVSHVDSFDPKPLLKELNGKPMPGKIERTQFDANGNIQAPHWETARYGESGIEITDMFPKIAGRADDLAIVRSMTAKFSEHAQGNFFMHTGFPFLGYPSAGSWVNHGCGTANPNLPGYVVLQSQRAATPPWAASASSATPSSPPPRRGRSSTSPKTRPSRTSTRPCSRPSRRRALDFIGKLDRGFADRVAAKDAVVSSIENAETAYLMQEAVPELTDISGESDKTKEMYGVNSDNVHKAEYARQCLMARRLVERGVRFVELSCCSVGIGAGNDAGNPWDQHGDLKRGHGAMAEQVDGPIAALIADLKERGMLDETLLVFTGEFGRTPFAQGSNGRDHNPYGFSLWLAGGGTKGGTVYGSTDDYGYHAVEDVATVYDLWATVLHLLGIDHEKLTYRWSGRDLRLTDVHGHVWKEILA